MMSRNERSRMPYLPSEDSYSDSHGTAKESIVSSKPRESSELREDVV